MKLDSQRFSIPVRDQKDLTNEEIHYRQEPVRSNGF